MERWKKRIWKLLRGELYIVDAFEDFIIVEHSFGGKVNRKMVYKRVR